MTKPSAYVSQQMTPFLKRYWHAEKACYLPGKEPFSSLNRSVSAVCDLVGANDNDQFAATSSAAAALQTLSRALYLERIVSEGCNHLLTTEIEESAMRVALDQWEKGGCVVKNIPLNCSGQVTKAALESALSPRTALVSLAWANSMTGVVHPMWELAEVCREKGVWLHVDVSSVIGKLYFQWRDLPIDFLTFDADRIHGPRGSGVLLSRAHHKLQLFAAELINPAAIVGLGIACEEAVDYFDHLSVETARLRTIFEQGIVAGCRAKVLFEAAERLPHVSTLVFPGISAEMLAFCLKEAGVYANLGNVRYPSLAHVLTVLGVNAQEAQQALSFGLSRLTTIEEIKKAVGIITDRVNQCQSLSQKVTL